jgi:hypothetical protein
VVALAALVAALVVLGGCAAGSERFVREPAGFWAGLWHGIIIIVTFIVSLFTKSVGIYESNNNGGWYNLGFLIGLFISIGGTSHHRRKRWKKRVTIDVE